MTEFTRNQSRFDPYKNFKFRIKWEGRYVAGVSKVSPLTSRAAAREPSAGDASSSRRSPGRTKFAAITLERGVTRDVEFERWANKGRTLGSDPGTEVASQDFRRDLVIEVYDEAGRLTLAYKVFRCWVSEFQALPDLDANANAVTIQHIKLENEGIERDREVPEPDERSADRPLDEP